MRGSPPAPDRTITFQNGSFRSFPELRWAWSNIRQLVPTVNVWRGAGPASVLPREEHDIGGAAAGPPRGGGARVWRALAGGQAGGHAVPRPGGHGDGDRIPAPPAA